MSHRWSLDQKRNLNSDPTMGNQPIKEDRLNSIDETASELENGNNMYNVCIPNTTRLPIEVKSEKKSNFQNVSTLFHSKKRENTTLFNPSVIEILSEDPLTQKHNLQTYCNIHNTEFTTLRNNPSKWTLQECEALIKAVKKYGTMNKWTDIAESVGTRTVSQCINKWRNDLSFNGRKQRMTKRAIEQVKQYIKENKSEEEIRTLMPQFSYIQIYQQVRKVQCNTNTWESWELNLLKELKGMGYKEAEIGRKLNNRHRDDVKNMWKRLKKGNHFS